MTTENYYQIGWAALLAIGYVQDWFETRGGKVVNRENYKMDVIRLRWQRLRIYRFRGSVVTDYRILRNYIKTAMRVAG